MSVKEKMKASSVLALVVVSPTISIGKIPAEAGWLNSHWEVNVNRDLIPKVLNGKSLLLEHTQV